MSIADDLNKKIDEDIKRYMQKEKNNYIEARRKALEDNGIDPNNYGISYFKRIIELSKGE